MFRTEPCLFSTRLKYGTALSHSVEYGGLCTQVSLTLGHSGSLSGSDNAKNGSIPFSSFEIQLGNSTRCGIHNTNGGMVVGDKLVNETGMNT